MIGISSGLPRAFGPYMLLRQIAVGGMAEIYLAKAKGIGGFEKLLALKMIHPRFSEDDHFITMLIEEAKISVQLNHVNIGQIFDLGRIDGTYYIAMEYIEGADAYRSMRRASEMGVEVPIDTAVYVVQEICAGLDYAHRKRDAEGKPLKIIHRDISPQNVIISFAGEVKIVDFGIAKASLRAKETEVGVIKGKYYYMSPEQAWGDPIDARTDIFSTGIILYEMLTGQMLYMEDNVPALLDRVRKADIAPPSSRRRDIPKALDDIVMKTLAKYPNDRYATAHDLQTALTRFLFSFSPDYTATMLAGLVTWLFEDEAKRPVQQDDAKAVVKLPTGKSGAAELMTGDDLSEEAVVQSVIFKLQDVTDVRAAKAMAALRQGKGPPSQDEGEQTSKQRAAPPRTRPDPPARESEPPQEGWGDETLIDRDNKFRDMADQFRVDAAKRRAPDEENEPLKRSADEDTRPVAVADASSLSSKRRAGESPSDTMRPPGRALPRPPPAGPPIPPSTTSTRAAVPGRGSLPSKGFEAPPPPAAPKPAAPSTLAGSAPLPQVAVGKERLSSKDHESLFSADTMAAQQLPPGPTDTGEISENAMTQVSTPKLSSSSGMPAYGSAPPRAMAPPPIASAQTRPIVAPPASPSVLSSPGHSLLSAPPDSTTGPVVMHDPYSGSYAVAARPTSLPRIFLWIAAAIFAVGLVVATVVFLTPAVADPSVLEITSHPPGAQVRVGEVAVPGATPLRVEGLEGGRSYQLEVRLDGYQPWIQQFQASPGVVQQIAILDAIRGTIQLHTNPEGAQIYVDNVYRGSTPLTIPGLEINRSLTIRAERRGFATEERQHTWNGQTAASLSIDLRPLPR